jgi:hypothetical protein
MWFIPCSNCCSAKLHVSSQSVNEVLCLVDMQDLLDDEAVLDAIDEENEFQALVVSLILPGLLCHKRFRRSLVSSLLLPFCTPGWIISGFLLQDEEEAVNEALKSAKWQCTLPSAKLGLGASIPWICFQGIARDWLSPRELASVQLSYLLWVFHRSFLCKGDDFGSVEYMLNFLLHMSFDMSCHSCVILIGTGHTRSVYLNSSDVALFYMCCKTCI